MLSGRARFPQGFLEQFQMEIVFHIIWKMLRRPRDGGGGKPTNGPFRCETLGVNWSCLCLSRCPVRDDHITECGRKVRSLVPPSASGRRSCDGISMTEFAFYELQLRLPLDVADHRSSLSGIVGGVPCVVVPHSFGQDPWSRRAPRSPSYPLHQTLSAPA